MWVGWGQEVRSRRSGGGGWGGSVRSRRNAAAGWRGERHQEAARSGPEPGYPRNRCSWRRGRAMGEGGIAGAWNPMASPTTTALPMGCPRAGSALPRERHKGGSRPVSFRGKTVPLQQLKEGEVNAGSKSGSAKAD
ncbi:hypothetical protein chiPu_0019721 [Chiloscyllium punctatum]|uniref:Uncharacterized protein n=1 Tax=Chiloscyllium punctatum TaxID=137246 RepID=A0A401RSY6_CHIPU|nr:hypothetical protein [Chiloscyllium punctatum]